MAVTLVAAIMPRTRANNVLLCHLSVISIGSYRRNVRLWCTVVNKLYQEVSSDKYVLRSCDCVISEFSHGQNDRTGFAAHSPQVGTGDTAPSPG
jgi:hypothetical protein